MKDDLQYSIQRKLSFLAYILVSRADIFFPVRFIISTPGGRLHWRNCNGAISEVSLAGTYNRERKKKTSIGSGFCENKTAAIGENSIKKNLRHKARGRFLVRVHLFL